MIIRWNRTRLASLILAVGFFFLSACLSTETTTRTTSEAPPTDQALQEIDQRIDAGEEPAPLLIERLEILRRLADESEPDRRSVYYEEMVQTVSSPDLQQGEESDRAKNLILAAYEREFQAGESGLDRSESSSHHHFRNASILLPEESNPYRHLSSFYYRQDRLADAIDVLEVAESRIDPFPPDMSERIAYLHMEAGELQKAIERYHSLVEANPDRVEVHHALVNAYILSEQHNEAVRKLRGLLESDPDNLQYRQSLAVELFFQLQDHWKLFPPAEQTESDIRSDLEWVDEAIEQLARTDDAPSANTEERYVMAQFYRNSGLYLLEQSAGLPEREAAELTTRGEYLLKEAIPRWEAMTDQNPENRELWLDLQEMYRQLGLDEQARQIDEQMNS